MTIYMNEKKFIIRIVLVSVLVILGGYYFATRTGSSTQVQVNREAKAAVKETSYDWGKIGLNGGNVEKVFEIKSEGTQPLKLSNISTSCMCTTAQLILGDETSPLFGMHPNSSYILEVPPKKSAKLKVVFDPAFHGPSGVGVISRQVTVSTNDPKNPELNFMSTAMVEP